MTPKRNQETGLFDHVNYIYTDESHSRIDWRKMVNPKYLVVNNQYKSQIEQETGKSISEVKVEDLEDKYLLILLAGLKELAALRGYHSVNINTNGSTPENCIVSTNINWIGNIETDGEEIYYEDVAGANRNNTMSIGKNKLGEYVWYLETIAANRSFCRAVRSFLGIHVVSRDEIGSSFTQEADTESNGPSESSPQGILEKKCKSKKNTFEQLKVSSSKIFFKDAGLSVDPAKWTSWADIPSRDCWTLLGKIEEYSEEKGKKKS